MSQRSEALGGSYSSRELKRADIYVMKRKPGPHVTAPRSFVGSRNSKVYSLPAALSIAKCIEDPYHGRNLSFLMRQEGECCEARRLVKRFRARSRPDLKVRTWTETSSTEEGKFCCVGNKIEYLDSARGNCGFIRDELTVPPPTASTRGDETSLNMVKHLVNRRSRFRKLGR